MAFAPRLMDHVLPSNSTAFERVLASQSDRLLALDTERIRFLWNPWKCHIDDLPYLAWSTSVDIWDPEWPEDTKRSVVANSIRHHQLKGTLAGIEAYVALVGSRIVKATTPPAKLYSGPSLTREQREAWLSGLPQVRVFRIYEKGTAGKRIFSGGLGYNSFYNAPPDVDHLNGYHGKFAQPNDAIERLRRRARWVENSVETDSRVENFESFFRVFKTGKEGRAVYTNRSNYGRFFLPSTASQRIITIEPISLSPWRNSVGPRLTPVTAEPELVAEHGMEGHAVFSGRTFGSRHFLPSSAGFRLFERYAVHDGTAARKRPSITFMGVGRYGMPPHTAELKIEIRTKQKRWKAGEGIVLPKTRFWMPHDHRPLDKNRQAVNAAKRLSDTVLLDTNTGTGFVAGLPFFAGDTFIA